ncbi:methyl-accepting chemotaxis protein [Rhizobium sp. G21]|uniref:methyl-accepting chemotaxis protein n=1 Tax=Rhizobium sp. G21 TaxID=2758439 RepID=UPI001600FAD3|nr:methyl-accepting chemotaxis protein [Rhizobium sp. G21]MBB1250490.1 methyl-accepting chemotaxis protein [Rhizobium sp. G21]
MLFRSATSRNIFAAVALGLVSTVAAASVQLYMSYGHMREASLNEMRTVAGATGAKIESDLRAASQMVKGLEMTISSLRNQGLATRENVRAIMRDALARSPEAFGLSTGWDPGTFDGKDSDFAGKPLHDKTGRYLPYVFRDGADIKEDVLVDYDKPGVGDYYIVPHDTGKLTLLEPYVYPVNGKDVLMTTISEPTRVGDKVVGYVGADIDLAKTAEELAAMKPFGQGYVALVSGKDYVVSHPDASMMGKPLDGAKLDLAAWKSILADAGQPVEITEPGGGKNIAIAAPVKPFEGAVWYAVVSAPEAVVFAELDRMIWLAGGLIAASAVFVGLVGWLIARRFIRRIETVIGETTRIAQGDLDVVLTDREKNDELGDLSRSLGILLDANRDKVRLEKEAESIRQAQEKERTERARIAEAQEQDVKFAVGELAGGLSRLSDGDMTVRLERPFTAALDEIRGNFNQSVEKLQGAMLSFSENAAAIQAGSEEIRNAADNLARRTEQQAASVEETAAALEEITTSVKDSTLRAEEAGARVARTKESAEQSGVIVRNAVEAMDSIEQSSQSISNIIGVIDEIAFQTNLLALNAGVEAARAGEAGKGFAVVAQEVRELAQRSANAAKEIKSLITASGDHVKRGVMLVDQTGAALESIVEEVQEINRNVAAIVQAAREQATGLQEINGAVGQMDQATQQNAAMVEESNAASHTLVTEVTALSNRLGQFNLGAARASTAGAVHRGASMARPSTPTTQTASRPIAAPRAAAAASRPAPSPARALGNKVAAAFGSQPSSGGGDWEEF